MEMAIVAETLQSWQNNMDMYDASAYNFWDLHSFSSIYVVFLCHLGTRTRSRTRRCK
jgi:hypothetical protein